MKKWFKEKWLKFKGWAIALLVAVGLITIPIAGMSGSKDFSWTNPTQYTDGSAYNAAVDQASTNIYCTDTSDGSTVPVIVVPNGDVTFRATLPTGEYQCYATVTSVEGAESFSSNVVTFTVDPLIPNPPVLN